MNILITGSNGFIGKNLISKYNELLNYKIFTYNRNDTDDTLISAISEVDAIIHLAGENRPVNTDAFDDVNYGLTLKICKIIRESGKKIPIILTSTAQVGLDNPYAQSKLAAEKVIELLSEEIDMPVAIYQLPGVFGKWCKPNYNSVVATFCYKMARKQPIQINDLNRIIRLVYVDDVVSNFINLLNKGWVGVVRPTIEPEYNISLKELAEQIAAFDNCRTSLVTERVGRGFVRALYSTYVSYLPIEKFAYDIPIYKDERGVFVEMLKTPDTGQFSYFTANPGVTRGGHYHHSKTEKFLVIQGNASFGFRNIITNESYCIETSGNKPQVVETVPGWTHDITNVGNELMVVMLWANEIFDPENPDTFLCKVKQ